MYETGSYFNGHGCSNPELDALSAQAAAAPDPAVSADPYQANQLIWEDAR